MPFAARAAPATRHPDRGGTDARGTLKALAASSSVPGGAAAQTGAIAAHRSECESNPERAASSHRKTGQIDTVAKQRFKSAMTS